MSAFGDNLKKARTSADFTQQQMADRFGVTRGAVAQWESGVVYPEASKLPDIAAFLGCSVDGLFAPSPAGEPEHRLGRFWMVHGIGQGVPRYTHRTQESARQEARRLAGVYPEITFVVLESTTAYRSEAPKINQFEIVEPSRSDDDGIPF